MVSSSIVLWVGSVFVAVGGVGFAWASQSVEVPLVWVLVLTFIPTRDLTQFFQRVLDASVSKIEGSKDD
jgi:hypothetical protein